jgi:hypothetical protein
MEALRDYGFTTWQSQGEDLLSNRIFMPALDRHSAIFFGGHLRSARLAALADSEAFDEIIHAIERLGSYLAKERFGRQGEFWHASDVHG